MEYARLLPAMNKKANGRREGGGSSARRKDPIDPPAPPLVKQWRKLDRQSPCWMLAFAVPSARALAAAARHGPIVAPHGQSASLAAPELGSCASAGCAWRLWAARHTPSGDTISQWRYHLPGEIPGHWSPRPGSSARPLGVQALPRVLELAASKVAHLTASDRSGGDGLRHGLLGGAAACVGGGRQLL